jgi:L-amino acid N-acyltransferase YncA
LKIIAWQQPAVACVRLQHRTAQDGAGRDLYTQLLGQLAGQGYRQVFADISQPNEASNGFHRSFGFTDAGLYRRAAWKHDVAWTQLDLPDSGGPDGPPGPIRQSIAGRHPGR